MPIPQLNPIRHYGHLPGGREPLTKKEKKRKIIKLLALIVVIGAAFSFIAGTIVVAVISRDLPDPDKLNDRQVSQSTKIYDRTGEHLLW